VQRPGDDVLLCEALNGQGGAARPRGDPGVVEIDEVLGLGKLEGQIGRGHDERGVGIG
jgi:hypothetical protein